MSPLVENSLPDIKRPIQNRVVGQASQPRSTVLEKASRFFEDSSRNRDEKGVRIPVLDFSLSAQGRKSRTPRAKPSPGRCRCLHTAQKQEPRDAGITPDFW